MGFCLGLAALTHPAVFLRVGDAIRGAWCRVGDAIRRRLMGFARLGGWALGFGLPRSTHPTGAFCRAGDVMARIRRCVMGFARWGGWALGFGLPRSTHPTGVCSWAGGAMLIVGWVERGRLSARARLHIARNPSGSRRAVAALPRIQRCLMGSARSTVVFLPRISRAAPILRTAQGHLKGDVAGDLLGFEFAILGGKAYPDHVLIGADLGK